MASPLADLYQRYKIGTRRIEQWLSDTANRDPAIRNTVSALVGNSIASSNGSSPIKVSTRDLVTITDGIVQSAISRDRPPADVDSIIIILGDVIAGRREYKIWHQRRVRNKDETYLREAASHEHFVGVLSEILARLKKIVDLCRRSSKKHQGKKKGGKSKKVSKPAPNAVDAEDKEAILLREIYGEPTTDEDQSSTLTEKTSDMTVSDAPAKAKPKPTVELELERPDDEENFALWCFLKECHKVRLFLRSIWEEHYAGKLSVMVAAEVTENGFILLSKAAWEFKKDFPHLASFDQVADHLKICGQTRGSEVESFSYEGSSPEKDLPDTAEALELLCIPAFVALHTLREGLRTFGNDNFCETIDLSNSCHMLNTRMMLALIATLEMPDRLFKVICDGENIDFFTTVFIANAHCREQEMAIDEMMHYQIYMDIMDIRKGAAAEMAALCTARDMVLQLIPHYEEAASAMMESCGANYNDRPSLRHTAREYVEEVLFKKLSEEPKKRDLRSWDDGDIPSMCELCGNFPVLCGRSVGYLLRLMYADGIFVCRQNPLLAALAHLYRASLEAGLLRRRWKDLDHVIAMVGPASLGFIGTLGSHTPVILSARRFGMAFGISAADYSKEHRNRRKEKSIRLPLPQTDHISKQKDRLDMPKSPWTSAMLNKKKMGKMAGLDDEIASIGYTMSHMVQDLLSDPNSDVDEEARKEWTASRTVHITTFLRVLKKQITEEEKLSCFDLHRFATEAAGRMRSIKNTFGPEVADLRARRGLSRDFNMVEMVDEILWASVTAPSLESSMLVGIAEGFEATIEKHDSKLLDAAEQLADHLKFKEGGGMPSWVENWQETLGEKVAGVTMSGSKVQFLVHKLTPEEKKERYDMALNRLHSEGALEEQEVGQKADDEDGEGSTSVALVHQREAQTGPKEKQDGEDA